MILGIGVEQFDIFLSRPINTTNIYERFPGASPWPIRSGSEFWFNTYRHWDTGQLYP